MSFAHHAPMSLVLSRRAIGWASGAGLATLFGVVRLVPRLDSADRAALAGRLDSGASLISLERLALGVISVGTLSVGVLVLGLLSLRRHGAGFAVRVTVAMVGSAASAELLKRVLPFDASQTPGVALSHGSFPSGHATVAAAVALGVAASVGPRLAARWWGPLVTWVALVAAGTVAVGWHRPSDAVGGVLLAIVWHTILVRQETVENTSVAVPRNRAPGFARIPRMAGRWWGIACAAILLGALVPRAGADVELHEGPGRLYLVGLSAVLAATGVLVLLVSPERVPALHRGDA
jgi:membrane-associated phospholipid phosphatase